MGEKQGRNSLCWCGSGIKYKSCHLRRDKASPFTLQGPAALNRRSFGKKYCLHPNASIQNCSPTIAKAHTIQRNGGLSKIARLGHVYTLKQVITKGRTELNSSLVGIREASTFTGFAILTILLYLDPLRQHHFKAMASLLSYCPIGPCVRSCS
jgi:hypothetical protein